MMSEKPGQLSKKPYKNCVSASSLMLPENTCCPIYFSEERRRSTRVDFERHGKNACRPGGFMEFVQDVKNS